ncbi:MAG TPA: hypothetical protein VK993_03345, partial [Chthoniobacterales bacterium]|nr:hypothetical protein [Chthoniobacterales bacterium]
QRVIELLTSAAEAHPLVAKKPAPDAFMKEFAADALVFDLVCWTDDPVRAPRVQSDVAVAVNSALGDAGIEIPFPQRNLHVQSIAPAVADAIHARSGEPARHLPAQAQASDGA